MIQNILRYYWLVMNGGRYVNLPIEIIMPWKIYEFWCDELGNLCEVQLPDRFLFASLQFSFTLSSYSTFDLILFETIDLSFDSHSVFKFRTISCSFVGSYSFLNDHLFYVRSHSFRNVRSLIQFSNSERSVFLSFDLIMNRYFCKNSLD